MYRLGDKTKLSQKIIQIFPSHSIYIEPFLGSGGLYFNKKNLASINLLNDYDNYVYSLWIVLKNESNAFLEYISTTPISESIFKYFQSLIPTTNLDKALKFVYLSSFSLFGAGSSFMSGNIIKKESIIAKINDFLKSKHIHQATFYNSDFRIFFKNLTFVESQLDRIFVYNDPPYLNTANNYETPEWTINDLEDLIKLNIKSGFKFAISEFHGEDTLNLFKKYNLSIIEIGTRKNIQNERIEILACNYKKSNNFLDIIS